MWQFVVKIEIGLNLECQGLIFNNEPGFVFPAKRCRYLIINILLILHMDIWMQRKKSSQWSLGPLVAGFKRLSQYFLLKYWFGLTLPFVSSFLLKLPGCAIIKWIITTITANMIECLLNIRHAAKCVTWTLSNLVS